jgi:two-component system phosphate regulon response regulator PhoB
MSGRDLRRQRSLRVSLLCADLRPKGENVLEATILLVEDDVAVSNLLAFRFREGGYRVVQAFDIESALRLRAESSADICLSRCQASNNGCVGTHTRTKQVSLVPLILLTARTPENDQLDELALGTTIT